MTHLNFPRVGLKNAWENVLGGAPPTFIEGGYNACKSCYRERSPNWRLMLDLIIGSVGPKPKIDFRSAYLLYQDILIYYQDMVLQLIQR